MKKLLILFLLLFTLTACSPENTGTPTPTQYFYDLTFRENIGYDLENGNPIYTDYMSTARQKISSGGLFIRNADFSPDVNAHHVLFWSKNNYYLGYQNFPSTDYEGDRYLGDISTVEITLPEHADKFSIIASKMSTSELIPHELTVNSNVGNLSISYTDMFSSVVDEQLITNGDFSNGITGWSTTNSSISVTDGIQTWTITNAIDFNTYFRRDDINTTLNVKYYFNFRLNPSRQHVLTVSNRNDLGYGGSNNITMPTMLANQWHNISQIGTFGSSRTQLTIGFFTISPYVNSDIIQFDYIYMFNISSLIANQQHSPMYNTTFDLMTDEQIKLQMDYWVENGLTPKLATLMKTYNLSETSILNHYHTYLRLLEKTDVTLEELSNMTYPYSLIDVAPISTFRNFLIPLGQWFDYTMTGLPSEYVIKYDYEVKFPIMHEISPMYKDFLNEQTNMFTNAVGAYTPPNDFWYIDPSGSSTYQRFIIQFSNVDNGNINGAVALSDLTGVGNVVDIFNHVGEGFQIWEDYNPLADEYVSYLAIQLNHSRMETDSSWTFEQQLGGFEFWLGLNPIEFLYSLITPETAYAGHTVVINGNTYFYPYDTTGNDTILGHTDIDFTAFFHDTFQGFNNIEVFDTSIFENTGGFGVANYSALNNEDKLNYINNWVDNGVELLDIVSNLNSTYEYVSTNYPIWLARIELIESYEAITLPIFEETVAYYILEVYPTTPSDTGNAINDQLTEWGLNTTLFKTIMIVVFMIAISIILALFGAKQSILILANTLLLIIFAIIGWISMWLFIPIVLLALFFIIMKFKSDSGGTDI